MYSNCDVRVGHSLFPPVKSPFFTGAISLNDYFENETLHHFHANSKGMCIYELDCHNDCEKHNSFLEIVDVGAEPLLRWYEVNFSSFRFNSSTAFDCDEILN